MRCEQASGTFYTWRGLVDGSNVGRDGELGCVCGDGGGKCGWPELNNQEGAGLVLADDTELLDLRSAADEQRGLDR